MKKILINAYALRPNFGSEGGAAWNWITGLASQYELFVITEGEWREEIEKAIQEDPNGGRIHIFFNPLPERVRRMCWNQGDYRFYFYYAEWQRKTLKIAREIISNNKINLIHQLNMIGFREPGYLWKIEGMPFVWGPIGGMNLVPLQYVHDVSLATKIKYSFKNVVSAWQYKHQMRVQKAIRRSNMLVAANKTSYEVLISLHPEKEVVLINETGCNIDCAVKRSANVGQVFKVLWVGRFIPTKLLKLSLQVIEIIKDLPGLEFHVVGQAFEDKDTNWYHQLASKMGLDDVCKWHGWISHSEVQLLMQQCDVFFFPSVVEGTPHVVLEAIANRLPVVCFDVCGQAEAVNDNVGRKLPLSSPEESILGFADILKDLYYDREKLSRLSENCELRRYELSWKCKLRKMLEIYDRLLN